jgi:hypothetical protein
MAPRTGEKPSAKVEAAPKAPSAAPDAPKAAAQAAAKEDRKGKADVVAGEALKSDEKTPMTPAENPEDLPDNQWSRQYYELKAQIAGDSNMQGPMMAFTLMALKLAAKYAKYFDMMPGAFANRVNNSEELKDKKLEKEEADKLVAAHLKEKTPAEIEKAEADAKKALDELKKAEEKAGHKLGVERASTKFVTNVLWGNDNFNDTGTLVASLLHTSKGEVNLYNQITPDELAAKSPVPRGTLVVFVEDPLKGDKLMAYATGSEDEFKYYDLEDPSNPIKTFRLKDATSPLKKPKTLIQMILSPNVEAYRNAKETPVAETAEETETALNKIKADNEAVAKKIKDKDPEAKTAATAALKAANEKYSSMEALSKSEEYDEAKLKVAEAEAKAKADAKEATTEEKEAYTKAQENSAAAKKFKENFEKMRKLRDEAQKNNDEVNKPPVDPEKALEDSMKEMEKKNDEIEKKTDEIKKALKPEEFKKLSKEDQKKLKEDQKKLKESAVEIHKLLKETYDAQVKVKVEKTDPNFEKWSKGMLRLEALLVKADQNNETAKKL